MKNTTKVAVETAVKMTVGGLSGYFISILYAYAFGNSSVPAKVVGYIGAIATGAGVGHGIDLFIDKVEEALQLN